jgi:hypothetical protein
MALAAIGEPSLDSLLGVLGRMKPPALGHAVRVCADIAARLDTSKADSRNRTRAALAPYLRHEDVFVRLVAVQGLAKLMDEPMRTEFETDRAEETNQFVLAAFRKALGGH